MKSDTFIRVLAGTMVLISVALAHFVSPWWLLLTCFVGLNLIQSAFTGFCLPEILARKLGWVKAGGCGCGCADEPASPSAREHAAR
ncbi:DUF2892 domain-containing protein [Opitutaceae bacterium EW11]|nr:DUF2892 domain-containing protein [Opitutaceae bacterium EW11]